MKIVKKILKGVKLCRRVNVFQTLWLYLKVRHPKSASLHVFSWSHIDIHKTAKITMQEGSFLGIGAYEARPIKETILSIGKDSKLVVKGAFTIFNGASVNIFGGGGVVPWKPFIYKCLQNCLLP